MNSSRFAVALCALTLVSCSSGPSLPTSPSAKPENVLLTGSATGGASATAVSATRMRLRIVGGGDIVTGLQTGQSISVTSNTKLDVWAEIQRLETDRARLVVDWGNGNADYTGCGSCRLENTYTRTGRYTLTAKVLDLNDTTGTPVASATVTITVTDAAITCATASTDFETFTGGGFLPQSYPGLTVSGPGNIGNFTTGWLPYVSNLGVVAQSAPITVTFGSDKNAFQTGVATIAPGVIVNYQAMNAQGQLIASGSTTVTTSSPGGGTGVLSFQSDLFRTVILTAGSNFGIDNVSGSCR